MWFIHFPDKPCHEWRDQSSPFSECLWIQVFPAQIYWAATGFQLVHACLCGNSAEVLELAVWAVTLPQIWVFVASARSAPATWSTGELSLSVFSQVPAVILSVLAERASAALWRSALHMNLCSEVLFLCLHHSLLQIKFRGDRTFVKCSGERRWTRMRIPPFKKCR